MSYKYCGLNGLQWAHRAFVVLFIMLPDVPVKNQNRVDTNNILLGRLFVAAKATLRKSTFRRTEDPVFDFMFPLYACLFW
jgi:hypothetical protein